MIQNGEFTSRVHVCESHAHPVFNQSLSGFICIICSHTRIAIAFAPGSTPDFNKWQGCSNGGKSQTPQKSLDQNSTPKKSHAEIPSHKNFQNALNAIARKKETLVLNNLVPRALFPGFGGGAGKPGKSALGTRLSFEYPKKPLLKPSYPKHYLPNFSYPQKSRNWEFQTQNNPSIIPVTWNSEYPPWAFARWNFLLPAAKKK